MARAWVVPVAGAQQGQTVPAHLWVDAVVAAAQGGGEGREEDVGFEAVIGAGLEVDPDEVQQLGAQGFRQAGVDQQEQGVAAVVGCELRQGGVGLLLVEGLLAEGVGVGHGRAICCRAGCR